MIGASTARPLGQHRGPATGLTRPPARRRPSRATGVTFLPGRRRRRPKGSMGYRERLERDSDRETTQAEIRRLIRAGRVRVAPMPGDPDRVRVIPTADEPPPPARPGWRTRGPAP